MTTRTDKRLALLMDADNLSGSELTQVFEYLDSQHYQVLIRRAYGGHEKLAGMKDMVRQRAVRAFVNQGKGTTDVALVVDAMDLLHSGGLPTEVAIASSDADFAPLALRLREAGIRVTCFAKRPSASPEALGIAYDALVFVDEMPPLPGDAKALVTTLPVPGVASQSGSAEPALAMQQPLHPDVSLPTPAPTPTPTPTPLPAKTPASAPPKQPPQQTKKSATQPPVSPPTDLEMVRQILQAVPGWLPNTIQNLNQLGVVLRAHDIKKGSKPLHTLFGKHPDYFKVLPTTGPAKQVKLLKSLK